MPIYEYYCETCGAVFEKIVPLNEKDNAMECPDCHNARTQRVVSNISSCGSSSDSGYSSCAPTSGFG